MGRHSGASTSTSEHERIDETAEHRDHERGGARRARAAARDAEVRDRFGGTNLGAAFFGWLVAVGMTILLSGVVGAVDRPRLWLARARGGPRSRALGPEFHEGDDLTAYRGDHG